ncbi:MAG: extracellular solute-binding protein [Chloroflexi bacterium]|nr:extracellular solute-binding protein [Chloroflexota bacterium]
METLAKGLRVLELFSVQESELSLTQVAQRLGMTKSTAQRFLYTLRDLGYLVQHTQTKRYRLGNRYRNLVLGPTGGAVMTSRTDRAFTRRGVMTSLVSASIASAGMAACVAGVGNRQQAEPLADGSRASATIIWGTAGRPDLAEQFQMAVDRYHAKQSSVRVTLEVHPEQFNAKLDAQIAAGTPPTVIRAGDTTIMARAAGGAIAALDELAKRHRVDLKQFYPSTVESYRWRGKVYGLPWLALTGMIWTNVNFFQTNSVPLPRDPWAWEDLLNTARRLTTGQAGEAGRIFGIGLVDRWEWHLLPLVHSWGGKLFDNDLDPTKMVIDAPAAEALQWYSDLYNAHHVAPKAPDRDGLSAVRFFQSGRAATFMSAVQVQDMRIQAKFSFDLVKLPRGKKGFAAGSTTAGFAVLQQAEHVPQGFDFISFLAGEEGQRILVGDQIPAHRAVAESDAWLKDVPPQNRKAALETLSVATPAPRGPQWEDVQGALAKTFASVWDGKKTALQGLQEAKPVVDSILGKGP